MSIINNLNSKFMFKVNYITDNGTTVVNLAVLQERIKNGESTGRDVAAYREDLMTREINGMSAESHLAESLNKVVPAMCAGRYTGIVPVVIPCSGSGAEDVRAKVNAMPQTVMSFVTADAKGLVALFAYSLPDGTLPKDTESARLFHEHACYRSAMFVEHQTGERTERGKMSMDRAILMTSDKDCRLNGSPIVITLEQPAVGLSEWLIRNPQERTGIENAGASNRLPGYSDIDMQVTKFHALVQTMSNTLYISDADNLMKLAVECCRCGIDRKLAADMVLRWHYFKDKATLVMTTFESAYIDNPLGTANPVPQQTMQQERLRHYLFSTYHFRRNDMTDTVEYQAHSRFLFGWMPFDATAVRTAVIFAREAGLTCSEGDIDRLVRSQLVGEWNPIDSFLASLPRWDGKDRLGELAARVPDGKEIMRKYFPVWMRMAVNFWRQRNPLFGATMMLMLVGRQGMKKSTFFRLLLPPELRAYYHDRVDFMTKRDAELYATRFCLVNLDEYDQHSASQVAFLKHLLQETDVKNRGVFERDIKHHRRYASFCATTNNPTPLTDPTGSRRYLCVKVDGVINCDTTKHPIDYAQLYAQIVEEIDGGLPAYFDAAAEAEIQKSNRDFYDLDDLPALFMRYFRLPKRGEEPARLTAIEIIEELREKNPDVTADKSTMTRLGRIIKSMGFASKCIKGYKYHLVARCR